MCHAHPVLHRLAQRPPSAPASTITPDEIDYDDSKNSKKKRVAAPVCLMHTLVFPPACSTHLLPLLVSPLAERPDSRKAQTCRGASMNPSTEAVVLSIVLHTSSCNMWSCLVCRWKGKTLFLPPHKKREDAHILCCLLYTSPSPRDRQKSRMPSSA